MYGPSRTLTESRPITPAEAAIVNWMLTHCATSTAHSALAAGIDELTVVGRCPCGCPSIDFILDGQSTNGHPIASANAMTPEGRPIGVILWGTEREVSGLELYDMDGLGSFPLPSIATFTKESAA